MCVYVAIIATILQVTLWFMNNAPALKYNGHGLETWLAGYLEKEEVWYVNVQNGAAKPEIFLNIIFVIFINVENNTFHIK